MDKGTWEAAFKKAVQAYFEDGDDDLEINKLTKRKYNKAYLDQFEEERLGPKRAEKAKKKVKNATDKE